MQLLLKQADIETAVRQFVGGLGLDHNISVVDFQATRGPAGIVAEIELTHPSETVATDSPAPVKAAAPAPSKPRPAAPAEPAKAEKPAPAAKAEPAAEPKKEAEPKASAPADTSAPAATGKRLFA